MAFQGLSSPCNPQLILLTALFITGSPFMLLSLITKMLHISLPLPRTHFPSSPTRVTPTNTSSLYSYDNPLKRPSLTLGLSKILLLYVLVSMLPCMKITFYCKLLYYFIINLLPMQNSMKARKKIC